MHPLLERARDGDRAARDELVRRFAEDLRAFVERETGPRLRRAFPGDDLCQDVFVQVFASLASLPDDADLATFRGRLLHNAEWILAQRGRIAQAFAGASAAGDPARGVMDPAEPPRAQDTGIVTRDDDLKHLEGLIDRLGPRYGAVVRLRMQGLEFADIAQRLLRSEASVRKQFQRAVDALRRALDGKRDE